MSDVKFPRSRWLKLQSSILFQVPITNCFNIENIFMFFSNLYCPTIFKTTFKWISFIILFLNEIYFLYSFHVYSTLDEWWIFFISNSKVVVIYFWSKYRNLKKDFFKIIWGIKQEFGKRCSSINTAIVCMAQIC